MSALLARAIAGAFLLAAVVTIASTNEAALDVAALDRWWNFEQPAASEATFRAEIGKLARGSGAYLELTTQIARAQGLQQRYEEAHATLDQVEKALHGHAPRVSVRYLLERGRVFNSSHQPERAVPLFHAALDQARAAGEDFLAIDAAHMLGIATPPAERLDWNLEAVRMTERTSDARSKRWLASLYNNIGWTYHDRGDYAQALEYFEKALPLRQARGSAEATRAARWSIARAMRSLGRLDEALAIQRSLLAELEASRETDGYVFEELGELSLAHGDASGAQPWFAKAYAVLSEDPAFRADNPDRLERLRRLGAAP